MASSTNVGQLKKQDVSNVRHKRFSCQNLDIEWTLTDADGINYIISQLLLNIASWSSMSQGLQQVQAVVNKNPKMALVRPLLEKARQKNDVRYLLQAYTVECDFYRVLNKTLAERVNTSTMGNPITSLLGLLLSNQNEQTPNNDWPLCFVGPIFDDIFTTYQTRRQFKGRTYRGVLISQTELKRYVVGKLLFNKAFTSTSKLRSVAEGFLCPQSKEQNNKKNALLTFIFNDDDMNFTIDLENISEFAPEKEVLIMPGIPFRITKIKHGNPIEIELEQYTLNHLFGKKK